MSKQTIAIVEDEVDITELVSYNLVREGFEVISADNGEKGLAMIIEQRPVLVVLDLMLPGIDGLEICRRMKDNPRTQNIPIVMMTAKNDESDIILGLGVGADDYVAKPFSPKELIARVKAVLRRAAKLDDIKETNGENTITIGDISIQPDFYHVFVKDKQIQLTLSEFKILQALISKPNRVLTREQLLRETVGDQVVIVDRNVDVHIRSIRKSLQQDESSIETVRGVGYRFKAG
jgi:DNA-binding response OmpR family regulator